MFDHHCAHCDARVLIFPSQVTGLVNSGPGIEVSFTCWCGVEQTHRTGRGASSRRLTESTAESTAARAA